MGLIFNKFLKNFLSFHDFQNLLETLTTTNQYKLRAWQYLMKTQKNSGHILIVLVGVYRM